MYRPINLWLFPALFIFLITFSLKVSANTLTADTFFDESFNDLQEELATAKEEGKKGLLVMFEMDECPFCHRMKTTILNQQAVQDYYREHFRIITIDIEGDLELIDFEGNETTQKDFSLKQYRVRATPVFLFFDLEGKPMKNARFTGAAKDEDEFMLLGRYLVDGKNTEMPFIKYKREQSKATEESKKE